MRKILLLIAFTLSILSGYSKQIPKYVCSATPTYTNDSGYSLWRVYNDTIHTSYTTIRLISAGSLYTTTTGTINGINYNYNQDIYAKFTFNITNVKNNWWIVPYDSNSSGIILKDTIVIKLITASINNPMQLNTSNVTFYSTVSNPNYLAAYYGIWIYNNVTLSSPVSNLTGGYTPWSITPKRSDVLTYNFLLGDAYGNLTTTICATATTEIPDSTDYYKNLGLNKFDTMPTWKRETAFYKPLVRNLTDSSNLIKQLKNQLNNANTRHQNDSISLFTANSTITFLNSQHSTDSISLKTSNSTIANLNSRHSSDSIALLNKHDTVYIASSITNDTLKISIHTGISQASPTLNSLKVYPNPASTILHIDLEKFGYFTAKISGITGQSIITLTSGTIDVSGLANGIYILTIYDSNGKLISTNKILIAK